MTSTQAHVLNQLHNAKGLLARLDAQKEARTRSPKTFNSLLLNGYIKMEDGLYTITEFGQKKISKD